ncbi:RNA-directed DNA methylation 4-like isoform X2 [Lotus japonicus]|uniref:RNA-directed DNA methylation 4-like isoform X2 n=1 Tax=Lotus japonicus TaxID=34305 RepID=UPI002589231E|nr:RNA-directed DNA methylation 4-like isoform X2 [Lotus japonicus]
MAESSSASAATPPKPVVVRVKRKPSQSPLDAFWLEINERPFNRPLQHFANLSITDSAPNGPWFCHGNVGLEINERPLKRPLQDFANLSISDSALNVKFNNKKVFMQHVETITSSEVTFDLVHSIVDSGSSRASESKSKTEERRNFIKKDDCARKQDQLLFKAKQDIESLAKDTRFEQIWKSMKGNKGTEHEKALLEICNFYDIVRIDNDEKIKEVQQDVISLEEKMLLSSFLPLLRDAVPIAASEIEETYVYDFYTVKDEMHVEDSSCSYPLVQVDEEDYYDGPDEDPVNDYPDEDLEHRAVAIDADDPDLVFGEVFDEYAGDDAEDWSDDAEDLDCGEVSYESAGDAEDWSDAAEDCSDDAEDLS